MSHTRRFSVAAVLAAAGLLPRSVPVLGPLLRCRLLKAAAGVALTCAFVNLARDGAVGDGVTTRDVPPYDEWTREELYRRAREREIPGRSRLDKAGLVEALRQADGD